MTLAIYETGRVAFLTMSTAPSYSQGYAESVLRSQKWRTAENSTAYLLGRLRPGMNILDVGCGTGTITVDLAKRVAPGRVVGVDTEAHVIRQARELAERHAISNVDFVVGDAYDLPRGPTGAPGDRFDVVHAHQVLLHLADPVAALRHMLTVVVPDGVVAVRDTDYAAMIWWPQDRRLDRWLEIYRGVAHDHGGEPDAGRRLLAWAHAAGATIVTPTASHWLHARPAEREAWGGMWAERIVTSTIAEDAVSSGRATRAELADIAEAWRDWAAHPDGWFLIPHGEIICSP